MWYFRASCYSIGVSRCFYECIQPSMPEVVVLFVALKNELITNVVAWTHSCFGVWDAISRYIYTGLQGGSIMKGWMKHENEMICCCSDGTRPVIFKIERIDED